jgi:putative transposase
MPRKRYTEEQIIAVLKEADSGVKPTELCRKYGVSDGTFYTWKNKYGGMQVSEVRKMKVLEDENRRLKHIVADLTLDVQALRAINSKNF